MAADTEEERAIVTYDVRPHPQCDVSGRRYRIGPWAMDLREQEEIWFINHGLKDVRRLEEEKGQSPGFLLCPTCGGAVQPTAAEEGGQGQAEPGPAGREGRYHGSCQAMLRPAPGVLVGPQAEG